jgi:hypothetical protein
MQIDEWKLILRIKQIQNTVVSLNKKGGVEQ